MTQKITVDTQHTLASMDHFYGVFFEDISNAGDGGLYAELIRNRSFEFCPMDGPKCNALTAWEPVTENGARMSWYVSDKNSVSNKNPHHLVLFFEGKSGRAGIRNLGFYTGIPIKKGDDYQISFYAKVPSELSIFVCIENAQGSSYYESNLLISSSEWTKYEVCFQAPVTDSSCRLVIGSRNKGKLHLDFVSMFPKNTYHNRKNGLRNDLASMIADLKPRFVRFPGGCAIHVGTLNENDKNSMYRWKNTLGPVEQRASKSIHWRGNQTFGLGYMEFFLFCEDIGAEPIPVLPAGYNPHTKEAAPLEELQPWIDDALDLIEFANGDPDHGWGKVRAELGHPKLIELHYFSIGSAEEGEGFWERYDRFHKEIRSRYPQIKLINTASFSPDGEEYERGWANARKNHSDLVDEHYYMTPEWLLQNCHRYDTFDRNGPHVFLGEYSSAGNTWFHALAEAAYMIHLEQNADIVEMACYAPLLCNVFNNQWSANLIYFNQTTAYGTANYYVQKLFMNHCGTKLLKTTIQDEPDSENLHVSSSLDEQDHSIILKLVNRGSDSICCDYHLESFNIEGNAICNGTLYEMSGFDLTAQNDLESPLAVSPTSRPFSFTGSSFSYTIQAFSIVIIRIHQ